MNRIGKLFIRCPLQLFCQGLNDFESAQKLFGDNAQQGICRNGQHHSGDACQTSCNRDEQEDFQWVCFDTPSKNDGLCKQVVDQLCQEKHESGFAQEIPDLRELKMCRQDDAQT